MASCPSCLARITRADMNLREGIAICSNCHALHRLGGLAALSESADPDEPLPTISPEPVRGATYRDDGLLITITASARSFPAAAVLLIIAAFWNGVAYFFALAAWTRILSELGIQPIWVSSPPPTSGPIADALGMPLALAVVMAIFMLPFMLIGFAMVLALLYAIIGRAEITIADHEAWIREAIGPWGRRKSFDPRTVTSIGTRMEMSRDASGDIRISRRLVIEHEGKPIRFAGSLTEPRRKYLERAMRYAILSRRDPRNSTPDHARSLAA